MWEQIERLEHHARLAPDLLDVAHVIGEFDAVDDDRSSVVALETIDAANQCRFARARWPDHDHDLLLAHLEVDVVECTEVVEVLVHPGDFDDGLTGATDDLCGVGVDLNVAHDE